MVQVTEVIKIRRKVLSELAKFAFEGTLKENISNILYTVVTEEGPRYRCCVHKERAVLKDRINLALSQPMFTPLEEAAQSALEGSMADTPIITIMPEACDQCPIDKFLVTDACRNCLAHNCIASCPRKAIMVVQNRAYIDKTKCVECGLCKKSCHYGAIIEISRPCENACSLGAIKADSDRRASIDYQKCVQCGSCKVNCPFGAISDQSMIVQVIQQIKSHKRVYAMLAPAFIGQFGLKVNPGQIIHSLKQMGFHDVKEVSLGADIVTVEETKEFMESVPKDREFMTTSCCPAFTGMVDQHLPELKSYVSSTVSPMVALAKVIKHNDPEAVTVFIGPCIAKKVEGRANKDVIDFVLTFEEVAAMIIGKGINTAEVESIAYKTVGSRDGITFARAGGVAEAVAEAAAFITPETVIEAHRSEGLHSCKDALMQIKNGKIHANFFEGMACIGGCVGGPGTLTDMRVTTKLVENFAANSDNTIAPENKLALEELASKIHWHTKN